MKTKFLIAVLFCAAMFSACNKNNSGNTTGNDSTGTHIVLPQPQADVGMPSISYDLATGETVILDTATLSMDINGFVDTLTSNATVTTKYFDISIAEAGPGKIKVPIRIHFKTKQP